MLEISKDLWRVQGSEKMFKFRDVFLVYVRLILRPNYVRSSGLLKIIEKIDVQEVQISVLTSSASSKFLALTQH